MSDQQDRLEAICKTVAVRRRGHGMAGPWLEVAWLLRTVEAADELAKALDFNLKQMGTGAAGALWDALAHFEEVRRG